MKELKITATTEQEFKEQAYEIAKSVNTTEEPEASAGATDRHSSTLRNPLYCKHYCQQLCLKDDRPLDCTRFDRRCRDYERVQQLEEISVL